MNKMNKEKNMPDDGNLNSALGAGGHMPDDGNSNSPFRAGLLSYFVKFFEMIILALKL